MTLLDIHLREMHNVTDYPCPICNLYGCSHSFCDQYDELHRKYMLALAERDRLFNEMYQRKMEIQNVELMSKRIRKGIYTGVEIWTNQMRKEILQQTFFSNVKKGKF